MARGKAGAPATLVLLKAAFIGCVVSIALIMAFALLMWKQVAGVELIPIVNAAIKVIGGAAAGFFAQRGCGSRAWLFGGAAGLIYAVIAYALFSVLSGGFALNAAMLSDMGIGLLSGMLCAMIARAVAR
mgnify:CR=1 FL=1